MDYQAYPNAKKAKRKSRKTERNKIFLQNKRLTKKVQKRVEETQHGK